MRNLFLTGPIGSGKSTCIAEALGADLKKAGGFLTVRLRDETGAVAAFYLQRPDGRERRTIIDSSGTMHMEVFETLGVQLLKEAAGYDYVILDEIGGFELLSDVFRDALMELLQSDVPCIGVMKGAGPAGKMIQKLGLADAYVQKAEDLRRWLRQDQNTVLYECGQYDPEGLQLARDWAAQYVKR